MRKDPPADIYAISRKFRRDVLRGETDATRQLEKAWAVSSARIQRRLKYLLREIERAQAGGVEFSPAWLYRQERFERLLEQIAEESSALGTKAERTTGKRRDELVSRGIEDADTILKATGVKGDFFTIDAEAFRQTASLFADGSPVSTIFQTFGPEAVELARRTFAEGMGEGANPRVIAKKLMERMDIPRQRALLIARTESLRAYRTAHQAVYEANSDVVVGVKVSSSRDGRTCPICLAQDGKILAHREQFASHPMCRCALLPYIPGVTPDRGTGDEWLRTQDEARQREALGKTRYEVWKSGQATLPQMIQYGQHLQWGKTVELIPLRGLRV